MTDRPTGNYPLERRAAEFERLRLQGETMAADAAVMLDRIGVRPGWRCLDIGCGIGGITGLLAERAGPGGRVVGLDADPAFLDHARVHARHPVQFVQGDAYAADLPAGSFDLVHARFVASTAGQPERLIAEAMRLARPGGTVALQDPDMTALEVHPAHPAWDRLKAALVGAFAATGADINLGRRLYAMLRRAGLADVQYRPFLIGVRPGDAMRDYLPATVESLRGTVTGRGLMDAAALDADLAACRAHLADPDTVFTTYAVAQVWGRTPGG